MGEIIREVTRLTDQYTKSPVMIELQSLEPI